ncbi:Anaerobic glycerol-3-phosphate dehydrogenase subunit A [Thalassoglobus neptunius]|uniref:Anaerobic glycerol-3-phosphate dehydrogenase subunit A n=1 Tax=Thalassoglobus neptunius TaxID=1938619 RepID=A0A5C5WNK9_9PLAN|nr:FAD-dependent oxidoreductase [Thalassoglobus neptunius]TWT52218.1 Anaerobic glycerol-3-phosphate dehydrogenase subunit A [Thalassoglobus neptunius]
MVSTNDVQRVVIVGGGVAGMAVACRLAQAGLSVTVLESTTLGAEATTRNQGWFHSGAWFARQQPNLARLCYESLQRTLEFAPNCFEPNQQGMYYLFSNPESDVTQWTRRWEEVGIPFEDVSITEVSNAIPNLHSERIASAFLLPDRSFRSDLLLEALATTARNCGAEIRTQALVTSLIREGTTVNGVVVAGKEQILASRVVLAIGAFLSDFASELFSQTLGEGESYTPVIQKHQLMALQPSLCEVPFCVVDDEGFNHIPHQATSIFGSLPARITYEPLDRDVDPEFSEKLWNKISKYFRGFDRHSWKEPCEWAGTTLEMLSVDQIEPGIAPMPTVINHSREGKGFENLWSVFPGRSSLWAGLAERAREQIIEDLDIEAIETSAPPWTK